MREPAAARVVELEVRFDAPPDEVFPYFVEPDRYVLWQGVRAELDPRPGGIFRVWMDANAVARGEFVEVRVPDRVVFTWGWEGNTAIPPGSTTVELTLSPDGDGTLVSLRHAGLPDDSSALMHEDGWRLYTGRLQAVIRGEEPPPAPMEPG